VLVALAPFVLGRTVEASQATAPPPIELRTGDRVVFLGDSFFEREYRFGLIETAITLAHPGKRLTFRSLGWTGDTVWGEARAYFGQPADGYAELVKNVELAAPTIIFIAYGSNESFRGDAGLAAFLDQYRKLLDDLSARTRRIVLLTPLPTERASSPLPPGLADERDGQLTRYAAAIQQLATARGLPLLDLHAAMRAEMARGGRLFQNGMHLSEAGYTAAARSAAIRTLTTPEAIEVFLRVWHGSKAAAEPVVPARQPWARLRTLIVAKNDAFFHRWRPANANYVYLARRRGGQDTTTQELPAFDAVIAEQERAIARLVAELTSGAPVPGAVR
jgi:lysophospholipase L1-like esterase